MSSSKVIQHDLNTIADSIAPLAQKLSGKTLLISGGAGFLGNYFIGAIDHLNRHTLSKPCRVISIDNFSTGIKYRVEEGPNFKAIKHNIKEPIQIDEDVDYIIHAAGIASPKFYRELKIETIDVATLGTKNMLGLAKEKKAKSMLYFSSSEVYGDPDPRHIPTPETYHGAVSCTGPRANYDESKRLGETYCVAYFETHNVPVKMVRPFNVYGPGMRLDDYRVIPNFIASILKGTPLPVYGGGNSKRTFCYITDAINGFFRVLLSEHHGHPFNVGNDQNEITMKQLAEIIVELFDSNAKIDEPPGLNDAYSQADPKRRCPDLTKMRTLLKYEPKVDLRTGLKRFMDWAIEAHPEYAKKAYPLTIV
ncbi:NAD-dependent epimerase/dehydratase family protein [Candidatus Woesearchaeota archaeon]|nr:NAD-dependent epimerase/dehydratase family protein [Candidatus Woesearchaeota archaeon]